MALAIANAVAENAASVDGLWIAMTREINFGDSTVAKLVKKSYGSYEYFPVAHVWNKVPL